MLLQQSAMRLLRALQWRPIWLRSNKQYFFSFSFLDRSSGAHEKIMLASFFFFRIDIRRHTRRSCYPFFSNWFDLRSMTFSFDRSPKAQVEIVFGFLFWLGRSSFYDVLVRSFPVGTNGNRACPSFLIGSIFVLWRSRLIVPCRHTWRLCLVFFSDWVDLRSMTFSSDRSLLAHVEIVLSFLFIALEHDYERTKPLCSVRT